VSMPSLPSRLFPVRVAYVWFVAFSIIIFTPFIWYALNMVVSIIMVTATTNFPDSFSTTERAGADALFAAVWQYMPVLISLGALIWAIMRTLKEKRYRYGV